MQLKMGGDFSPDLSCLYHYTHCLLTKQFSSVAALLEGSGGTCVYISVLG